MTWFSAPAPVARRVRGYFAPVNRTAQTPVLFDPEMCIRDSDVALWNGNDTSLSAPVTTQYMGVIGQIQQGGLTTTIGTTASIVDGLKSAVAQMVANNGFYVRPTAIYANPVLLDLIDREMKTEFNVVLNTGPITGGISVKMLSTQAGDLPLIRCV